MKRQYYILLLIFSLFAACKGEKKEYAKIPLEDFFRNPEKSNMLLSPDGSFISYIKNYKNRANIFCQNLTTGKVYQLTYDTVRGITNYLWVDNNQILYLNDIDGNETFHLFAVNKEGTQSVDLTPFENIKLRFLDIPPQKGDEIYICLNKRKAEVFDLYKLNYKTGKLKMIDENPGNISYWKEDIHGDIRLASSTDGVNETILFKKEKNAAYTEVITLNFKETFYPISFTEDGNSVYALSSMNRDKVALVVFDLVKGKETQVVFQHQDADISNMSFSYKTHKPLFANYRSDQLKTHYFDKSIEGIESSTRKIDPKSNYSIINYTTDDTKFLIRMYSDKSLGAYYMYDVAKNELKEIAKVSPWLNEKDLAETQSFLFKSRDGLDIHAYLTLPNEKREKYPLIVLAHSNLWQRARWAFNSEVQFFANRGYAVLRVNHRGVEGFGKKFHQAGYKEIGRKMQDDYTDAVFELIKEGIIDTARIGIYGASFGGYFALNGLVRDSGLYKCAASYSGFTNLFSYIKEIPPYYHQYLDMIYEMIGNPEKDVDYLRECSPAFHIDKMKCPLFIAHGEKDQKMSVDEINQFVKSLKNKNVKVNYLLVPDEGHIFRKEENKINLYTELEMFFEENLLRQ